MEISPIIEADDLLKIYRNHDVLLFDASNSKNAAADFLTEHLEGAVFMDLNSQLASPKNDLAQGGRHPLPDIASFNKTLTDAGISKEKHIIIYDRHNGSNAAARFWWMMKSAGHAKVQVLNGGLDQAKKKHFPISSGPAEPKKASQPYHFENWALPLAGISEVESASLNPEYIVIDVRSRERFEGIAEPIDLIAGHIPGAINVPFMENLDKDGLFLKPDGLQKKYRAIFGGIRAENTIVHCGSGVTACHTLLAMSYAGLEIPRLYVGSWSEWSRNNKKIEKSPALPQPL